MAQVTNRIVNQVVTDTGNSEQQIEKLENSISTLDGAINLVGGTVEFLAGALVLTGAASEETAAQFESVALGAIAVADGANRALQGYKILKTETKIIDKIQKAFNKTLLANPYAQVAIAVGVLVGAYIAYRNATSDAAVEQKRLNELQNAANEQIANQGNKLRVLQSIVNDTTLDEEKRNGALRELQELLPELEGVELDRAGAIEQINTAIEREVQLIGQRAKVAAAEEKLVEVETRRLNALEKIAAIERGEVGGNVADKLRLQQLVLEEVNEDIEFYTEYLKENYVPAVEDAADATGNQTGKQEELNRELEKTIALSAKVAPAFEAQGAQLKSLDVLTEDFNETFAERARRFIAILNQYVDEQQEFFEGNTAQAIEASLATASQLLRVTSENIDDSTKEGFEKSKQFKIAETRIASFEAAFQAYKSVVGVPIVGQILAPLAAAAALATGQNAINNIKASTFESTGNPSFDASTPSVGGVGGTAGGTGVPQIPGFGTSGVTTLNAVVLAGDVTSAQAQDAAIRNRRRFGRGG